jgi:hypothetical protein
MFQNLRVLLLAFLLCFALAPTTVACEHGSLAKCTCGCGGTPRPYCAHKGCVCSQSKAVTVDKAQELTKTCTCGCEGTARPSCAHKDCQCAQTNLETGERAPTFMDQTGQDAEVAACSCGCGGTPRPYCAHKGCACASAGAASVEKADALSATCGCGCKGTARPGCAHKNCQCANMSLETGEEASASFQDPMALSEASKKCGCGCGGSPRPTCAHKDCACAQTNTLPKSQAKLVRLSEAGIPVRLIGDGTTTSHVTIELTNNTDQPIAYQCDAFTQFSPAQVGQQALTTIEEAIYEVPAGETVQARLETVCSDVKSNPPPGQEGGEFTVTKPDPVVVAVIETAGELAELGQYDELPMPRCKALETVRQLTLWSIAGETSDNPKDQITREGFKEEIYSQLGKKPEDVTPEQEEQIESGIENIFEQVDLTKKKAKSKQTEE